MERKSAALLDQCPTLVLSSITEEGYPRGCVLVKVSNEGFQKIRVSTGTSSRKTKHFLANPKASICFYNGADGVTLLGKIRVLTDPKESDLYWQDWMIDHFPLGKNDPEFCVLEFTTEEATIWIDNTFETYRY
ncbi:MAG: pyridoxamine 5'-phosphate oxidase family protein [Planctomycetia bacterium]|nr:pyridoxamine 5'-phosphate oxidase family protein [Planctomycetia bacterium]